MDLPTPEGPSSATVWRFRRYASSASSPSPLTLLTTCTGTPKAMLSTSALRLAASSARSAFVRRITGLAPLSRASARYRSILRRLSGWSSALATQTTAMLAATICSSVRSPATLREKRERRGSTSWISDPARFAWVQEYPSPIAGKSPRFPVW